MARSGSSTLHPRSSQVPRAARVYRALVIIVALLGLALGLLLILAIARWGPPVEQHARLRESDPEIPPAELEDLVRALAGGLGLEVVMLSRGTHGVVDATLRDPRPLAGTRLLLRATPVLAHGKVDAPAVLELSESVRADETVSKGILIALAGFTDEAQSVAATSAAAIELYDGPGLLALARDVVPDRAPALLRYRGF